MAKPKKSREEKKRRLAAAVALFLALVMLLSAMAPLLYSLSAASNDIFLEAEVGFSGYTRAGEATPFRVRIVNNGAQFEGEIRLQLSAYELPYSYPIEIPAGGSKKISFTAYIPDGVTDGIISAIDSNGEEHNSITVSIDVAGTEEILGMVLSDDFANIRYMRNFVIGEGISEEMGQRLIEGSTDLFPDSLDSLMSFGFIMINNFSTSQLSNEQLDALTKWLNAGGLLIIGGGDNYSKNTSGLGALLGGVTAGSVNDYYGFKKAGGGEIWLNTTFRAVSFSGWQNYAYASDENQTMIAVNQVGSGNVVLLGYDPGLSPVADNTQMQNLLSNIIESYMPNATAPVIVGDYNYNMDNEINKIPQNGSFGIVLIMLLGITACVVVVLAAAFVLKKFSVRHAALLWGIPLVAVAGSLGIYALSSISPFKSPVANTVAVVDLQNGSPSAEISGVVTAFSPSDGENIIEVSGGSTIVPDLIFYNSWGHRGGQDGAIVVDGSSQAATKAVFNDSAAWQTNSFAIKQHKTLAGTLSADVYFEGGYIVGTIKNDTGIDYESVIVGFQSGNTLYLGALADGDEVELSIVDGTAIDLSYATYGYNYYYSELDYYSTSGYFMDMNESMQIIMRSLLSMCNLTGDQPSSSYTAAGTYSFKHTGLDFYVYGFSTNDVLGGGITVSGEEASRNNVVMARMSTTVDIPQGEAVDLPSGIIPLSSVESSSTMVIDFDQEIYLITPGECTFTYTLPDDLEVDLLYINESSLWYGAAIDFVNIYNVATGSWELMEGLYFEDSYVERYYGTGSGNEEFSVDDLYGVYGDFGLYYNGEADITARARCSEYIDPVTNEVKLKVSLLDSTSFYPPEITVGGIGK